MSPETRPVREGMVVGIIAYAAVAVFYALFDVLAARGPLFTVNLLGKALFRGERDPAILSLPIRLDAATILAYNGVHLVISLAIGLIVMTLVAHGERNPARAPAVVGTIFAGFVVTILAVGVLTNPIRDLLPWWSIVVANTLAVLAASFYLLQRNPELWRRLIPFPGRSGGPS